MIIKTNNPATATLHDSDCMDDGYVAEFNDEGEARVKEPVGTALAEKYSGIEAVEDPSPPPDDGDESADSDDDDAGGEDEQTDDSDTGSDTE